MSERSGQAVDLENALDEDVVLLPPLLERVTPSLSAFLRLADETCLETDRWRR
jgi:hypothetical protein